MERTTQSNIVEIRTASNSNLATEALASHSRAGEYEPFVDEHVVAEFLEIKPRRVLEMARKGFIPAHPLGDMRKTWRFKISEIDAHFSLPNQKRLSVKSAVPVTPQRRKLG